ARVGGGASGAPPDRPPAPPRAGPPARKKGPPAGTVLEDRLGDPLPEGALVRFGSTRFNHPGGINGAALAPDGKVLATESGDCLRLIDTTTGRVRLTLPSSQIPVGYNNG